MLSYIATEAMYICYKAYLYIESLCIKAYCIAFFQSRYILFFQPQLFYLKNYLSEAGLFRMSLIGRVLKELPFFTFISKIYICTHKQLRK